MRDTMFDPIEEAIAAIGRGELVVVADDLLISARLREW